MRAGIWFQSGDGQRRSRCRTFVRAHGAIASQSVRVPAVAGGVIVDQAPGDAHSHRDHRQVIDAEPARIGNFLGVYRDLTRFVPRVESQHDRVRKGPRLTGEVSDLVDFDSDLFANFAADAFLK